MVVPPKKLFIAFVLVELICLCGVLWVAYPHVVEWARILRHGEVQPAVIRQETLLPQQSSPFKYYSLLKPNARVEEQPEWLSKPAVAEYNDDGLNDRTNYVLTRTEGTLRIIALGDSFTYGEYVDTAQSWPEVVEVLMNRNPKQCGVNNVEVLNLGVHGFDIPYLTQRYQDVGKKYDADLILWLESGTGFTRVNEVEIEASKACEQEVAAQSTKERVDCWQKGKDAVQARYSKQDLALYLGKYLTAFLDDTQREGTPVFFYTFTHLSNEELQTLKNWTTSYTSTKIFPEIPSIYEHNASLPDGHPNPAGHELIAKSIYQNLLESYCTQR